MTTIRGSNPNTVATARVAKSLLVTTAVLSTIAIGCQHAAGPSGPPAETSTAQMTFAPQVPPPIARTQPQKVVVNLEVIEQTGELAGGVKYNFWTYNGHVPGPFIRVRQGDTVEVHLKNSSPDKTHTVDFHFVSGPGGGAPVLMANPGQETVGQFKALRPGLFIYHCAANPMPAHMSNGLYGLVLVEPEGGLEKVDREFYVMQSEFYTEGAVGEPGLQAYSSKKAAAETPEYVVFNGNAASLMGDGALKARTGERVRIYFGNLGPNKVSSFHIVGMIFDTLYREGSLSNAEHDIQTTLVPSGSASIVEFVPQVPGNYTLVDHAIFRVDRGAMGILSVEGAAAPDIYHKAK
jgi:nitrite reductase (NO-forming)